MAVSVLQNPSSPNASNNNLVYTLSSSLANEPQFRYVIDVYENGSSELLTRLKTYPNISGNTNVDVGRELNDRIEYDYNWKATGSVDPVTAVKTFNLRFGEEYGTTISSGRTIYTGSLDYPIKVFPGTVYKNEETISPQFGSNILSNTPEAYFQPPYEDLLYLGYDDYHTITLYDPSATVTVYVNGPSPTNFTVSANAFGTVGVGPQNLKDYGISEASVNTAYRITTVVGSITYSLFLPTYTNYEAFVGCSTEYTRFAWINHYGFWDYYNVFNPLRKTSQVNRSLYERPFVRYEDSIASYDISNRGNTQYKTDYIDTFSTTTNYLTKEMSQWLTEMFNSPEVYIQKDGEFIPIIITNTNEQVNMNSSRNKLFQYEIQFKYANQRQSR